MEVSSLFYCFIVFFDSNFFWMFSVHFCPDLNVFCFLFSFIHTVNVLYKYILPSFIYYILYCHRWSETVQHWRLRHHSMLPLMIHYLAKHLLKHDYFSPFDLTFVKLLQWRPHLLLPLKWMNKSVFMQSDVLICKVRKCWVHHFHDLAPQWATLCFQSQFKLRYVHFLLLIWVVWSRYGLIGGLWASCSAAATLAPIVGS